MRKQTSGKVYPGGKSADGVYQKIINQIPPHDVYIGCFLGGDGIMRHIRPARKSIGVDIDKEVTARWRRSIAGTASIGEAFEGVPPGCIVKTCDAISFLQAYKWRGGEFVYLDPPYLLESRRSKARIYKHEFGSREEHSTLLNCLLGLPCMVAISSYPNPLYDEILASWRKISYNVGTQGGHKAVESLYMNYGEPMALHDYRYLGENYREREKITRQKKTAVAKFKRMKTLQRYAILWAMEESGIFTQKPAIPPIVQRTKARG